MKLLHEGKHILWMVWALVAVGVLGGIVTIVLIGWNTSSLRAQRERLAEQEREWTKISEEVRKLAVAGESEVRVLLDGDFTPHPKRVAVDALRQLIQGYREAGERQNLPVVPLQALGRYSLDLEQVWDRAHAWRKRFQDVEDDVQEHTDIE